MNLDCRKSLLVLKILLFSRNNSDFTGSSRIGGLLANFGGKGPAAVFSPPGGLQRVLLEPAATGSERNLGLMFRGRLEEGEAVITCSR